MKVLTGISMAAAVAGLCMISTGAKPLHAFPITGSPVAAGYAAGYVQGPGWDEPPREFDEVSRKGFHDGVEGARKDFGNHRAPDPHNRDEFRHPHVPDRDKEAYRRGFERGYQVGWDHISHER